MNSVDSEFFVFSRSLKYKAFNLGVLFFVQLCIFVAAVLYAPLVMI